MLDQSPHDTTHSLIGFEGGFIPAFMSASAHMPHASRRVERMLIITDDVPPYSQDGEEEPEMSPRMTQANRIELSPKPPHTAEIERRRRLARQARKARLTTRKRSKH